jgi:hypothetical protein
MIILAEREGFEPSVTLTGHNGFRDRPDQPLWHLSECGEIIALSGKSPSPHTTLRSVSWPSLSPAGRGIKLPLPERERVRGEGN